MWKQWNAHQPWTTMVALAVVMSPMLAKALYTGTYPIASVIIYLGLAVVAPYLWHRQRCAS